MLPDSVKDATSTVDWWMNGEYILQMIEKERENKRKYLSDYLQIREFLTDSISMG